MGFTAFLHVSNAFPNFFRKASGCFLKYGDQTILEMVISAFVSSKEVEQVVIVTSDHPDDKKIIDHSFKVLSSFPEKKSAIHRTGLDKSYSFKYTEAQLREFGFPLFYVNAHGTFAMDGFFELAGLFKTKHFLSVEVDQVAFINADIIDDICREGKERAVSYVQRDPYRELIAGNVQYITELFKKHKGKLSNRFIEKGLTPLMRDLIAIGCEDGLKLNSQKAVSAAPYFFPIASEKERALFEFFSEKDSSSILEKADRCIAQCSMYSTEYVEVDCLSREYIQNLLKDTADSARVYLFKLYDDMERSSIVEALKQASATGAAVWFETDLVLESDLLKGIIDAGIDLFILQLNRFFEQEDRLFKFIDEFERLRGDETFPLLVGEYITDPWITAEADAFVRSLRARCHHLSLRSPRPDDKGVNNNSSIDFAPLRRLPCRQVLHAAAVNRNGEFSVCARDPEYGSKETLMIKKERIIKGHCDGFFSDDAYSFCKDCREWYNPLLSGKFHNVRIPFAMMERASHIKESDSCDAIANAADGLLACVAERRVSIFTLLSEFQKTLSQETDVFYKGILSQSIQEMRNKMNLLDTISQKIRSVFIPVGDAYIAQEKYEKGLDAWEKVLKYDPSNDYIHGRLDELLEACEAL